MSGPRVIHEHGQGPAWIMLHGFTQTGACFDELASHMEVAAVAPDLPGHGPEPGEDVTLDAAIRETVSLLRAREAPCPVLGYSQGGRIALHVALEAPDRVSRLVICSASPGIADPEARARRAAEDEARAQRLEAEGLEAFLEHWSTLPLFAGLGSRDGSWRREDRRRRLTNTESGLAAALRGLGLAQQEDLLDRLGELQCPTLFLAGTRDEAYCHHALNMAEATPLGAPVFIPGAGHSLVGEASEAVARVLKS